MNDPIYKSGPATQNEPKKEEDEEDSRAVRSTRPKRAAMRLNFQALEAFSSTEESDDGNYEPSDDAGSDDSSNDEGPSDDKEIHEDSANRSDGLGDRLAKYQEAFKLAMFGIPPSTAVLLSERPKSVPKMAPALSPDYFHHFTDRLERINELNRSIASTEKVVEECKLAAELLENRAGSGHVGAAVRELQEVRMNRMRELNSTRQSDHMDEDLKEAESA